MLDLGGEIEVGRAAGAVDSDRRPARFAANARPRRGPRANDDLLPAGRVATFGVPRIAVALLAAIVVFGAALRIHDGVVVSASAFGGVWAGWWSVVSDPRYWVCLLVLIVAERLHPALAVMPNRRAGLAQDATWFVIQTLLGVTVVAAYLAVLSAGVDAIATWWHPDLVSLIGTGGVAVAAVVVGDLAAWWSHWLHHRSPVLWAFHSVHHSQTAMNVLSDNRQHVVETMVNATLTFLPARLLGLDAATAGALTFLVLAVAAFIHANIRTDLGPLRFVLISPQAHRVHHSVLESHYDTNYGAVFAFWDYLFGTRNPDRHAYPDTGVNDREFPLEQRSDPISLVRTWAAQTAYPFAALRRATTIRAWSNRRGTSG